MDTQTAQKIIAQNIAERGYRDGWTAQQFAARNVAKAQEELAELGKWFSMPFHLWHFIQEAGAAARQEFDQGNWRGAGPWLSPKAAMLDLEEEMDQAQVIERAKSELADLVVVCLNMADVLDFDVVAAAVEKSQRDIKRGVRVRSDP